MALGPAQRVEQLEFVAVELVGVTGVDAEPAADAEEPLRRRVVVHARNAQVGIRLDRDLEVVVVRPVVREHHVVDQRRRHDPGVVGGDDLVVPGAAIGAGQHVGRVQELRRRGLGLPVAAVDAVVVAEVVVDAGQVLMVVKVGRRRKPQRVHRIAGTGVRQRQVLRRMAAAAGSMRLAGMMLPGKGWPVSGSRRTRE